MSDNSIGQIVKDFGVFFVMAFTVIWYYWTKNKEKNGQRKALAAALLAEIRGLKKQYKKVELRLWDEQNHNNIQSLEEDYMTVYNNSSDKISLLSLDEVMEITTFYTHLKAHIDTLRVLAKMRTEDEYLYAGTAIFGNLGNALSVIRISRKRLRSTHNYAFDSQSEVYDYMDRVEYILSNHLKKSFCERFLSSVKITFNQKTKQITDNITLFR